VRRPASRVAFLGLDARHTATRGDDEEQIPAVALAHPRKTRDQRRGARRDAIEAARLPERRPGRWRLAERPHAERGAELRDLRGGQLRLADRLSAAIDGGAATRSEGDAALRGDVPQVVSDMGGLKASPRGPASEARATFAVPAALRSSLNGEGCAPAGHASWSLPIPPARFPGMSSGILKFI
jgi:hypothetical protein